MTTSGVELATAYVTLAVSTKGMERDIRRQFAGVERDAATTGTNAGKKMGGNLVASAKRFVGPLAAAFGIAAIAKSMASAITAGSDFQQAVGGTDAVFKKEAAGIKKSASSAAVALGLPKTAYLELATVLGAGLKNKGLKDFAGQTEDLIALGADLAAQYGGSTQDAVAAISSLMRGEADPIERYGIGIGETAVNAELARKGLSKLKGAALDQAKAQARVDLLFKQSKDAMGAFGRESDTYAGKQARLSATLANIKTEVGTALLPIMTKLSDWFLTKGVPAIKKIGPPLKAFFDALSGKAKPLGMVSKGMEKFARAGTAVRDAFLKVWEPAKAFFDAVTGKAKPLGMVAEGMGKFAAAGDAVRDAFLKVWEPAKAFFDALTGNAEPLGMVSDGMGKFAAAGIAVRDAIATAGDKLRPFGQWLIDDLWPALKDGYETIMPALQSAFQTVADAFKGDGTGGGMDVKWADFAKFITDKLIPGIAILVEQWLPVAVTQFLAVKTAIEGVWSVMMFLLGVQRMVVSGLITGFAAVSEVVADMLDALSHVPGFGWAKTAADKLRGATEKALDFRDAINDIPESKNVTVTISAAYENFRQGERDSLDVLPKRERGGPVRRGQPYIVGEKRPELFVPNQSGTILPAVPGSSGGASAAMGGFDYRRNAEAVADAMQQTPLSVGVRETDRALMQARAKRALL